MRLANLMAELPAMQLECDRVLLRDFRADDLAAYRRLHADPRYLQYYAPDVGDPESQRRLVGQFVETALANPRRDFTLAIVERAASQLIGVASLRTAGHADGQGEFGFGLSADFWGRGLATEAARALLQFGFDALRLAEIRGRSVTQNLRVTRLVSKLGFDRLRELEGAEWMRVRGWTHTEWSLTKLAWTATPPRLVYVGEP
jgi:RimJ/RimL family protein N-acetyltransferase